MSSKIFFTEIKRNVQAFTEHMATGLLNNHLSVTVVIGWTNNTANIFPTHRLSNDVH